MRQIKFWTINCSICDDREFEELISDIERFIDSKNKDWMLPQSNSEQWLNQFIREYAQWPGRKFSSRTRPLEHYFKIDSRISQVA